ncbi:MAG: hypothetical protein RR162_00105 [Oscillospiraceae bacterium]
MLEIIEKYNTLCVSEKSYLEELDKKIIQKQEQLKRLEKRREKAPCTNWVRGTVVPLAKRLEELTGLTHEIYGPFGLTCSTSIYLRKDMTKSICDQETRSITLRPDWDGQHEFCIKYETGEMENYYPSGSLGDLNGMGKATKRLPDTIEEILAILVTSGRHGEATE